MKIKMDKAKWSQESKRSFSYDAAADYYEDINYKCYKCNTAAIFSAEAQKTAFEVKKRYIWQRRTLCNECYTNLNKLISENKSLQEHWVAQKICLKKDCQFLKRWLDVLEALDHHGKPKNHSLIAMLNKLLKENA